MRHRRTLIITIRSSRTSRPAALPRFVSAKKLGRLSSCTHRVELGNRTPSASALALEIPGTQSKPTAISAAIALSFRRWIFSPLGPCETGNAVTGINRTGILKSAITAFNR
jgi:hypothetical protein